MVTINREVGVSEATIHQQAMSVGRAGLWVRVERKDGRSVCGFIRTRYEDRCWCLDLRETIASRTYGISNAGLKGDLTNISNYMITNRYHVAKGGVLGYLKEVEKMLQKRYLKAELELVAIPD